ncbi:MAG: response regulator [Planctomycetes bacterium]|nr:response regulator [Planctomycetota bacterium]
MGKLQGDVGVLSIADLLQFLSQNAREGVLTISQGDHKKAIYLCPTGIRLLMTTSRRTSSLGEILIRTKKITRPQLDQYLEEQKRTGKKLGEIVGKLGLVSKKDIDRALREQVEEEIYDLFTWTDACFEFVEGAPSVKSDSPFSEAILDANPTTIMLEAARRADEIQQIMKVIRSEKMIAMKTTRPFDAATAGDDPNLALAVYSQITGRYSIEEVIRRSLYPRFEALRTMYLLATKGYVRIFDRESATTVSLRAETTKVKLPIAGAPAALQPAPTAPAFAPGASGRRTILLLGEMLKYRSILAAILREGGFDVIEEVAGQALAVIGEGRKLDCVILDIGISTSDGFQFCTWLSENTPAPIIVLSTDASRETAQLALGSGARAYIVKPFTREVILERLGELFRPGDSTQAPAPEPPPAAPSP